MLKRTLLICAVAIAAAAALTATASAFTATLSPAGAITAPSLGTVSFVSGETVINCNYTLRGELNRSFAMTAGTTIGRITGVTARECNNGATATILGLPYTIVFLGFAGTLPDNAGSIEVAIQRFSHNLSLFGGFVNCLYTGELQWNVPLVDTGTNTDRTELATIVPTRFRKVSGAGCANEEEIEGQFALPTQTVTIR